MAAKATKRAARRRKGRKASAPRRGLVRVSHDDVVAERCRRDLRRFHRECWPVIEPGTQYVHGWHIDAICEHLQAVTRGEIQKLIVNVPPRHTKSLTVAVIWPAWAWASDPALEWIFASYAKDLSTLHSVDCRRLVESDWYRARWGDVVSIAEDENRKTRFENTAGGVRYSTSVGGTVTGMGGHVRVYDDPHKVEEVEGDDQREKVARWHDRTMSSRIAGDPEKAAEVLIMQRLHEGDLTGHLLEKGSWTHLCLPAEYEPKHPFIWPDDPRTERGELLWPERYGRKFLETEKREMGSYAYAGQFQQLPAPSEGGIFDRRWWRRSPIPQLDAIALSIDCAFKEKKDTDYVVVQAWGADTVDRHLIAQIRERLSFTKTLGALRAMVDYIEDRYPGKLGAVYVEEKANGDAVLNALRKEIAGLIGVNPTDSKEARGHAVTPLVEAGNVHLPDGEYFAGPIGFETDEGDTVPLEQCRVDEFIDECAVFPNGVNDDQVDAMTQALTKMRAKRKRKPRSGGRTGSGAR